MHSLRDATRAFDSSSAVDAHAADSKEVFACLYVARHAKLLPDPNRTFVILDADVMSEADYSWHVANFQSHVVVFPVREPVRFHASTSSKSDVATVLEPSCRARRKTRLS